MSVCRGYRCALSLSLRLLSLQVERVIHPSARRATRSAVSQLYKYTAHAKFDAEGALLSKYSYLTSVCMWVFHLSASISESPARSFFFYHCASWCVFLERTGVQNPVYLKHKVEWFCVGEANVSHCFMFIDDLPY